ncbi:MAG TPA: saccharopine dehydrogenase C-terminal domain-containing protein [Terriglobales bacterium]|nr:saccharopine dehydrogenase C-terminal domain-containing protein [Terriglobales bacterium]
MKLLVIGSGMMGSAAAYDMARNPDVRSVTLADTDHKRAKEAAARLNKLIGSKRIAAEKVDASSERAAYKLMRGHDACLSAVPYFYNLGLAKAAISAKCHFADLGGNNVVVRKTLELSRKGEKAGVALAPDCGLSPGMASILAGELMRRIGGRAEALKIYVGGLPENPKPPFNYQLVFSVEGLINEYCEPANVLRKGKIQKIEPLSELETFRIKGLPPLDAFHTSGGTSTLPETFAGKVGECFEKTLRYKGHFELIRGLYDLGMFSSEKRKINGVEMSPRVMTTSLFLEKFAGKDPDLTVMRVEAHSEQKHSLFRRNKEPQRVLSFTLVDRFDPATQMTSMMRTTAWPAAVVVQMMASGMIEKRGALLQERDVSAEAFLAAMAERGIEIQYREAFVE